MTIKKAASTVKSAGKTGKKTAPVAATKATTKRKAAPASQSALPRKQWAAALGAESTIDQDSAHGRANDASDLARDKRLRNDLEDESNRSPGDRHRERLTAVEPEEDGVRDNDDDGDQAADKREEAISEQDADDDRT